MAPRTLDLEGEQTNGTVLRTAELATVREYDLPSITAAGSRTPRIMCSLPVCVTSDPAAAWQLVLRRP